MAEAAAALGLACNIMQIAQYGVNFVNTARKIAEYGHDGVEQFANLKTLVESLTNMVKNLETQHPQTVDQVVLKAAIDCKADAELIMSSYAKAAKSRKRDAFPDAFKLLLDKGKIAALESRLDRIRSQSTNNMVVALSHAMNQTVENQGKILQMLDEARPSPTDTKLSESGAPFASKILHHLTTESTAIPGVTPMAESLQGTILGMVYDQDSVDLDEVDGKDFQITETMRNRLHKKFLAGLEYDGMESRAATVAQAHETTFRWIFQDESQTKQHQRWGNFKSWLESDDQLYWITGKAGSGKSTLMKYISQPIKRAGLDEPAEPRCLAHLQRWSNPKPLAFASFYFWAAGTKLQTSLEGLFRSLLHQILKQYPHKIPDLFPRRWAALCLFNQDTKPFVLNELQDAILGLIYELRSTVNFCLFIDGLDEFDGDHASLIELLAQLLHGGSIKICVASRPWNIFKTSLRDKPSLQLENITFDDIKRYVMAQFQHNPDFALYKRQNPDHANTIVEGIVLKASGVFLWVKLVVSSLLEGLSDGDRPLDLERRLDALPPDLEDLYDKILNSLKSGYLKEVSQYFSLLNACPDPPSAILFSLADEENPQLSTKPSQWQTQNLKDKIELIQKRLSARCKGLIEVGGQMDDESASDDESTSHDHETTCSRWVLELLKKPTVQYLHRTVKDYIQKPEVQKHLLEQTDHSFDPHLRLCSANLAITTFLDIHAYPKSDRKKPNDKKFPTDEHPYVYDIIGQATEGLCHAASVSATHLLERQVLVEGFKVATDSIFETFIIDGDVSVSRLKQIRSIINRYQIKSLPDNEDFRWFYQYVGNWRFALSGAQPWSFQLFAIHCGLLEYVESKYSSFPQQKSKFAKAVSKLKRLPLSRKRPNYDDRSDIWAAAILTAAPNIQMLAVLLSLPQHDINSWFSAKPLLKITHWDVVLSCVFLLFGNGLADSAPDLKVLWIDILLVIIKSGNKIYDHTLEDAFGALGVEGWKLSGTVGKNMAITMFKERLRRHKMGKGDLDLSFLRDLKLIRNLKLELTAES